MEKKFDYNLKRCAVKKKSTSPYGDHDDDVSDIMTRGRGAPDLIEARSAIDLRLSIRLRPRRINAAPL